MVKEINFGMNIHKKVWRKNEKNELDHGWYHVIGNGLFG